MAPLAYATALDKAPAPGAVRRQRPGFPRCNAAGEGGSRRTSGTVPATVISATAERSQIPALARRPFPRPGPALGRGQGQGDQGPSLRDDLSWNGRKEML